MAPGVDTAVPRPDGSPRPLILIVEDEPAITALIEFTLKGAGWDTLSAADAEQAWRHLQRQTPHMILLDWMLPRESGLQLLSRLRQDQQFSHLPVIMLTAKSMEEDKVAGLNHGADDYITKPFSPRELTARVNALLRRQMPEHGDQEMTVGPLRLDPVRYSVTYNDELLEVGPAEFRLLKFFMARPERVFSRDQLLDRVWGTHVAIGERTVDVHVLRLRKSLKAGGALIRTVRGVGYMLSTERE